MFKKRVDLEPRYHLGNRALPLLSCETTGQSLHFSVHLANKFLLAAHDVQDTVPDTGETTVKNRAIKIINPRKCKVMWRKKAESKHRK